MTPFFHWNEDEWAALGPGSLACIQKIFGPAVRGHEEEALKWIHASQHDHFARLRLRDVIPQLWPGRRAGLTMVDIEHSLCEVEKYSRENTPEIRGKRHRVARSAYVQTPEPLTADIPHHWKHDLRPRSQRLMRPPPVRLDSDGEPLWEVSHIVTQRPHTNVYLVRWTGYDISDDTWETETDLATGAGGVLREWQSMKARIDTKVAEFQAMGEYYRPRKKHVGHH